MWTILKGCGLWTNIKKMWTIIKGCGRILRVWMTIEGCEQIFMSLDEYYLVKTNTGRILKDVVEY